MAVLVAERRVSFHLRIKESHTRIARALIEDNLGVQHRAGAWNLTISGAFAYAILVINTNHRFRPGLLYVNGVILL